MGSAKIDGQVSLKLHRSGQPQGTGRVRCAWWHRVMLQHLGNVFRMSLQQARVVGYIFDLSMTILDRRPCHRPMIQAHFGFSCAWIMLVGNKGEVELCKLVQSVWVKLKCRLHSSGASWRQAQEFLKITCISVFFFHFQLATKKTKKKTWTSFSCKKRDEFRVHIQ